MTVSCSGSQSKPLGRAIDVLSAHIDNELYVEYDGERFGPYHPISGPIPLNRYRALKKTAVDEKADRIRQLADQLGLPIAALAGEPDICITDPAMPSTLPRQPFDAVAFESRYPTIIAAKLAIADEIATPLAKLSPDDRAFSDGVLAETMTRSVVLARVREYFQRKKTEGDGHAG
jgi:hypothetical protein